MLRSLIFLLAVFALVGCGSDDMASKVTTQHNWVEDNDLWMEDSLDFTSNVDEAMFDAIIDVAEKLYAPIAKEWNETLTIKRNWTDGTVNASAWRDGQGATEINMYGGLARRAEVVPIGFALVLCHELSHLYGGTPYIDVAARMAAEGQSDWKAAGWCLKGIVDSQVDQSPMDVTPYIEKVCGKNAVCMRQLVGGNSLGKLLAKLSGEKVPNFETPDKTIVKKTNVSYPKTTQCRLDSYHNGTLGKDRPLCWYKP
jgi:hypothetical protein